MFVFDVSRHEVGEVLSLAHQDVVQSIFLLLLHRPLGLLKLRYNFLALFHSVINGIQVESDGLFGAVVGFHIISRYYARFWRLV